jgi:CRP/FNR family cyclic AMP-dependent transcriptional regulator
MNATQNDILSALDKGEWFGSLPEELRRAIVERSRTKRYERGQVLRREGVPPSGLTVVLEGQVGVQRRFNDEGHSLLHVGGPGFWTGEVAMLLRCENIVAVVAQSSVLALELPTAAFEQIVAEQPDAYRHFARLALERYTVAMRQLTEILGLDKETLLRARLADLIDMRHQDDPTGGYDIAIPQGELAALMGVARQTLNDLLKRLERDGLIEVSYRKIRILDLEGLRGANPRTDIHRPWQVSG